MYARSRTNNFPIVSIHNRLLLKKYWLTENSACIISKWIFLNVVNRKNGYIFVMFVLLDIFHAKVEVLCYRKEDKIC